MCEMYLYYMYIYNKVHANVYAYVNTYVHLNIYKHTRINL